MVLSPDLRVIALSNAYQQASMRTREEIVGRSIFDLFPDNPATPDATWVLNLRASLNRVIQHKTPDAMAVQRYDIARPESEGVGFEERYWSSLNSPVVDADNNLLYIVHHVEDITEYMHLKQQEQQHGILAEEYRTRTEEMEIEISLRAQQLQAANAQLREADKIRSAFFANVSHELCTPLSLIIAPIESMLNGRNGSVPDQHVPLLHTVHNNAIRLLQMVIDLLDFAKIEAGKIEVQSEAIHVGSLICSVVDGFAPAMKAKGISYSCRIEPQHQTVATDRHLFERILFNLLSNAVKFTPTGGRIDIRCTMRQKKLRLSVADTGIGIAKPVIKQLFQKFCQVEGASTRKFEGTGLGLAIVKEFAELLGGKVSVKSAVGKGSVFTVECVAPPIKDNTETATNSQTALMPPYQQPELRDSSIAISATETESFPKVLVCENNEELQAYIVSLLRNFCNIQTAKDGNKALELVRSWKPDLVIADVMMPHKDGIEVCRTIKLRPDTSAIIVVLLAALTHRETMLKGREAKADEYLFKPFHPEELVTRIQLLLAVVEERKKHKNELARKNSELARINSDLQAFSYSVSHDLRAPLRAIIAYTRILAEEYSTRLENEDLQMMEAVAQNAKRMGQLIDGLIALAQLDKQRLHKKKVNMTNLAHSAVAVLRSSIPPSAKVTVYPLLPVVADTHLIEHVLINLMGNAIKYSSLEAQPTVAVSSFRDRHGDTVYCITDNGTGFDMKYYTKLFGVFQRLHAADEFEGTGMGLALVQRIIDKHNGSVWATSVLGKGSSFYFSIGTNKTST